MVTNKEINKGKSKLPMQLLRHNFCDAIGVMNCLQEKLFSSKAFGCFFFIREKASELFGIPFWRHLDIPSSAPFFPYPLLCSLTPFPILDYLYLPVFCAFSFSLLIYRKRTPLPSHCQRLNNTSMIS